MNRHPAPVVLDIAGTSLTKADKQRLRQNIKALTILTQHNFCPTCRLFYERLNLAIDFFGSVVAVWSFVSDFVEHHATIVFVEHLVP